MAGPGADLRHLPAQLPAGVTIYLPEEAARLRGLQERLLGAFRLWGYREVMTPTVEFLDVLALGTDHALQERMFRMIDRDTGRMLALRADVTPQIARLAATRLRDRPKPYRLAYRTNVFRYDEPRVGRQREFYQAGVELIGLAEPEADAETIALAIEGFRAAGLERFQIDVGQVEFVRGALEAVGSDAATLADLRDALLRKDRAELARLTAELALPAAAADLLLALPELHGRPETVLDRAGRLVQNTRSERALAGLTEVLRLLSAYGVTEALAVDLGEVRGFDYYSGLTFEGYVDGFGAELVGGGRYDHLLARFGAPAPATGFAFDVNRLLLARAIQGLSVARDIMRRPLAESLAYARDIRAAHAVILDEAGLARGDATVVDVETGREERRPLAALLRDSAATPAPADGGARG